MDKINLVSSHKITFENVLSVIIALSIFSLFFPVVATGTLVVNIVMFVVFLGYRKKNDLPFSVQNIQLLFLLVIVSSYFKNLMITLSIVILYLMVSLMSEKKLDKLIIFHILCGFALIISILNIDISLGGVMANSLSILNPLPPTYRVHGLIGDYRLTAVFLFGAIFLFAVLSQLSNHKIAKPTYACLISVVTIALGVTMASDVLLVLLVTIFILLFTIKSKEAKLDLMFTVVLPVSMGLLFLLPILKISIDILPIVNNIEEVFVPRSSGTTFATISSGTTFCLLFIYNKFRASLLEKVTSKQIIIALFFIIAVFVVIYLILSSPFVSKEIQNAVSIYTQALKSGFFVFQ